MRIAQVVPPLVSTPPKLYGGTERIASMLIEELVRRGHRVTLYATGDSKTKARLKYMVKKAVGIGNCSTLLNMAQVHTAYKDEDKYDVFHNHAGFFGIASAGYISKPVVTTMHNDYLIPGNMIFDYYKKETHHVFISKKQQKRLHGLKSAGVVYNATDTNEYTFCNEKKDYLLFLGNVYRHKGSDIAIKVAKKLHKKLIISGKYDQGKQEVWFNKYIRPQIDKRNIVFHPLIPFKKKLNFYQHARCLLFPIRWEEPFGLVMIEAMSCGTPVVAMNRGSVPEIIKHGETGFIANNYREFVKYVKRVDEIDPKKCRRWVERKFSIKVMTDGYEKVYKKIMKS